MTIPTISRNLNVRLHAWLVDEFRSNQFTRSLTSAFLIFIMEISVVLSFAAFIFSGEMAKFVSYGIGFIIMGDALICLIVSLTGSHSATIAIEQDAPAAIIAIAVATILMTLPVGSSPEVQFATVVAMILITTLSTGIIFMILGIFKSGGLARFLPYPVIGGFLAGTGWLLLTGGINMMSASSLSLSFYLPPTLIYWLPGLALGILFLFITNRYTNPLLMPGILAGSVILFYFISWIMKIPVSQLSANGWLLGPFPAGGIWQFPLNLQIISNVDWSVLKGQIDSIGLVIFVSVISLLLNANSLELVARKDIDLNHELISAGLANLAGGLVGGIPGYHAISLSTFNVKARGGRLSGILTGIALAITVFVGATIFSFIPKFVLGGMLVFLGLSLLVDWLYRAWFKFSRLEFLIILLIVLVIAVYGFLEGIVVGIAATIVLFIIGYSQVSVVKHALPGTAYRSRVVRDQRQQKLLEKLRLNIYILQLQGFIFFGTAYNLFEQLKERVYDSAQPQLRFVIIDCCQVTGLDSTGLLSFLKIKLLAQEKNITLILTGLSQQVYRQFLGGGLLEQTGVLHYFPDLDHGIEWCENELVLSEFVTIETKGIQDLLLEILPDAEGIRALFNYFEKCNFATGETIIRQGDESDKMYFIESGQVTAWLENPGREPLRLETMQGGRVVGELGVYLKIPRSATIKADHDCVVYILAKHDLERMENTDPKAASALHHIVAHILGERVIQLNRTVDALQQ